MYLAFRVVKTMSGILTPNLSTVSDSRNRREPVSYCGRSAAPALRSAPKPEMLVGSVRRLDVRGRELFADRLGHCIHNVVAVGKGRAAGGADHFALQIPADVALPH